MIHSLEYIALELQTEEIVVVIYDEKDKVRFQIQVLIFNQRTLKAEFEVPDAIMKYENSREIFKKIVSNEIRVGSRNLVDYFINQFRRN